MHERAQARILLIPSSIGMAHIGRLLLVAEELRQRGGKVAFAYGGKHYHLLEQHGFTCYPVSDISAPDLTSQSTAVLEQYTAPVVERCVRDELAVYAEYLPHAVVTDVRPTAAISSRLAGIPLVAVLNGSATSYFDMARLLVTSAGSALKYRLTSALMHSLVSMQGRRLAAGLRAVAEHNGVTDRKTLFDFLAGDLTLLADLPGFVPLRAAPHNYLTTGPLIWEGAGEPAPPLPPSAPGQRRVYITIGNTGNRRLLDTAMAAFANQPQLQIIATTGAYLDAAPYQNQANFHAYPFLPGSSVMRQSDLVIHAGGNGTTYQSLKNGLPAVVVPSNNEQIVAARLLRYHKVGVPLALRDLTPERLRDLTVRLLDNRTYHERARAFQAQFAEVDGAREAARQILAFISGQTDQRRPRSATSRVYQKIGQTSATA